MIEADHHAKTPPVEEADQRHREAPSYWLPSMNIKKTAAIDASAATIRPIGSGD